MSPRQRPGLKAAQKTVLDAAKRFTAFLKQTDSDLRNKGQTDPSIGKRNLVNSEFRAFISTIEAYKASYSKNQTQAIKRKCREQVGGWLFRSRYFNRSFSKPHGFPGDFQIIEWIYDLETDLCRNPIQPAIVNCLDYIFSQLESVKSGQERRRYFADLLKKEHRQRKDGLRILDVACGGARYIMDFLSGLKGTRGVKITLVDQDAAALAFCETASLKPWLSQVEICRTKVAEFAKAISGRQFDVVISAGLLDYLKASKAKPLLDQMLSVTAPGGVLAVANFHPADPSRSVNEWLVDWPLVYRDASQLSALFRKPMRVETKRSKNGAIVYATVRKD